MKAKVTALNTKEKNELKQFITEAVLSNATFPSFRMGVNSITIQELIHSRNIDSIKEFGKQINKQARDFDPDFSTKETYKVAGFEADRIVGVLKLIIRNLEFEDYKKTMAAEISAAKKELAGLQTPKERKAELTKKIAQLTSELED